MKPIPLIFEVFSLISQEERQRSLGTSALTPDAQLVFAMKSQKPSIEQKFKSGKKDRLQCAHYGILGHTKDKCYRIHGFPPNCKKQIGNVVQVNQVSDASILDQPLQLSAVQYQ